MMDNITRNQWTDINLHRIDTILTITTTTKQGKIRQGKASMSSCIHPPWIRHTYFELEAIFNLISTPSSWNSIIYYVTKKTPCSTTTTTTTTTFLHFQLFNHRLSIYYHGQPWPRYSNVPYLSLAEYFTLHTSLALRRHATRSQEKRRRKRVWNLFTTIRLHHFIRTLHTVQIKERRSKIVINLWFIHYFDCVSDFPSFSLVRTNTVIMMILWRAWREAFCIHTCMRARWSCHQQVSTDYSTHAHFQNSLLRDLTLMLPLDTYSLSIHSMFDLHPSLS